MKKPLFSALGIALCVSALGIFSLVGCARKSDPITFLPAQSEVVLQVHVKEIVNSKIYKESLGKKNDEKSNDETAGLLGDAGVDPEKDVITATAGMVFPANIMGKEPTAGVVVFSGSFDPVKVNASLAKKYNQTLDYAGRVIYHDDKSAMTVLDNTTMLLALGSPELLKTSIDIHAGKAKGLPSDSAVVQGVPAGDRSRAFWLSASISDATWNNVTSNPMTALFLGNIPAIGTLGVSIGITDSALLNVFVKPVDKTQAAKLKEGLEGLLGMAKMFAGSSPDAADALANLATVVDGERVKISTTIPAAQVAKVLEKGIAGGLMEGLNPGMGPGGRPRQAPPGEPAPESEGMPPTEPDPGQAAPEAGSSPSGQ